MGLERNNILLQIYRNRSEMECDLVLKDTGEIIDRIPVQFKSRENKLDYLSVSKIHAYEQCPACFYKQYISDDGITNDGSNFFTVFGSILHEVVELASRYYTDNGVIVDPITIYDDVWKNHNLSDFNAYKEGKTLIRDYFTNNPIDQRKDNTYGVEVEWRGELGGVTFGLMFDYIGIMKEDPTVGVLKDYKTNRMPFTPGELEDSLQLCIYEIILRRHILPDIKTWVTGYEMFRFGWQQCPQRSEEDLLNAEKYVENIAYQIKHDNKWEEKLNNYCGYRDCRFTCKKYKDFIENPQNYIDVILTDTTDLEKLEKERELLTTYEKIAKSRKEDAANIIKTKLEQCMINGEKLIIDGKELSLYSSGKSTYDYYDTKNVLLVNNKLDILDKCLSIQKTKLDKEIANIPELALQLAGCQHTSYASPYIVKKKAK